MALMTGAEGIVKSLLAHGVDTLFALPGVQLDPLFNALYDAGDAVRVIQTRHEQGAAYMALGHASATGLPGCYAVVPGPGVLNTTAALATAHASNAKVLCLTGQIPSNFLGRGLGLLHEIPDQLAILKQFTKWAQRIETPAQAPGLVAEAFRQMRSGRPRPAALEMAVDTMARREEMAPPEVLPPLANPPLDLDAIARAARVLAGAKAPLIFVGGGAIHAAEEVKQVAEMLQAPVVAARMGQGILSSRHYLSHTLPAGHRLWAKADVVLALGTRLMMPRTRWGVDDDLKIIRIDIDPEEHTRYPPAEVAITTDCHEALRALIPEVEKHNPKRPSREEELMALKGEFARAFSRLGPQMAFLNTIREELPDDGLFVDELTQVGYVSRFAFDVYRPRTFISMGYLGTLGWGFSAALGVKVARPDQPVISINGDGGFMFTVQELATAVQHKIGLVALVFNDGAFGNVKRIQQQDYGNRVLGSDLHNPDFVKLAESFGAQGLRAETPEDLRQAIRRGFEHPGPTLIEIPVGELPDPWPLINLPLVRGVK